MVGTTRKSIGLFLVFALLAAACTTGVSSNSAEVANSTDSTSGEAAAPVASLEESQGQNARATTGSALSGAPSSTQPSTPSSLSSTTSTTPIATESAERSTSPSSTFEEPKPSTSVAVSTPIEPRPSSTLPTDTTVVDVAGIEPVSDTNTVRSWDDELEVCLEVDLGGVRLKNVDGQRIGPMVSMTLTPGAYQITLVSEDEFHESQDQSDQLDERWYAELFDSDGAMVDYTPPIFDLPDDLTVFSDDAGVYNLEGVVAVRAQHWGELEGDNSVVPAMVRFSAPDCSQPEFLISEFDPTVPSNLEFLIDYLENDWVPPDYNDPAIMELVGQRILDPVPLDTVPGGQVEAHGSLDAEGVRVVVESAGGLLPNMIFIKPDLPALRGLGEVAVGPVVDITTGNPDSVLSATITLPYYDHLINGSEEELWIATYDEEAQLWVPVQSPVSVDPSANTLTTTVSHFSLFAPVTNVEFDEGNRRYWSSDAIIELFGTVGARCLSDGDAANVAVAFAVDNSLSMNDNDPSNQRIDAALEFLSTLDDSNSAGVVKFGNPAGTALALTPLSSGRDSVTAAIESARSLTPTGTDISGAISRSTDLLRNRRSGDVGVIILLTDGEHAGSAQYDPAAVTRAAGEGIAVFTVGLGGTTDADLLRQIASVTGGSYIASPDASDLRAAYDQIANTLIDDGTDTDGDGLSDCEETNGLFIPWVGFRLDDNGVGRTEIDATKSTIIRTNPNLTDTDGDGTSEEHEVSRQSLEADAELASTYRALIELGITEYFKMVTGQPNLGDTDSDTLPDPIWPNLRETCGDLPQDASPSPFLKDTDDDGIDDGTECFNKTDPLSVDFSGDLYGVPGITTATLLAPSAYIAEGFPDPPIQYNVFPIGEQFFAVKFAEAIYYDEDFNCVANCDTIENWSVTAVDTSLGCRWLAFTCDSVAELKSKKIREIVESQAMFDPGGSPTLTQRFLATDTMHFCSTYYTECEFGAFAAMAALVLEAPPEPATRLVTDIPRHRIEFTSRELNKPGGGMTPRKLAAGGAVLTATGAAAYKVYRDARAEEQERADRVNETRKQCLIEMPLLIGASGGFFNPDDCLDLDIFLPSGGDAQSAAVVDLNHIAAHPIDAYLNYQPQTRAKERIRADMEARKQALEERDGSSVRFATGDPRRWYTQFPTCEVPVDKQECQEYPLFATLQSGPGPGVGKESPRASMAMIPRADNRAEGSAYGSFTQTCPRVRSGDRFLVYPRPNQPLPSDYACTR